MNQSITNASQLAQELSKLSQQGSALSEALNRLQAQRSAFLLAGDMQAVDKLEIEISSNQQQARRITERSELLEDQHDGFAEADAQIAAEARHIDAVSAQVIGQRLVASYERLSCELAQTLKHLTAVETFIHDANRANAERAPRVLTPTELHRSKDETSHIEIQSWWTFPAPHRWASDPVSSVGGSILPPRPEPLSTGERDPDTGNWIFIQPILKQRPVKVIDSHAFALDPIPELVTLPGIKIGDAALWGEDVRQNAADDCQVIVHGLIEGLDTGKPTKKAARSVAVVN